MPVIGFINSTCPDRYATGLGGFRQGIGEVGYVEGRNLTIEYGWAEVQYDRLRTFAADLGTRRVSAIFTTGVPGATAAKAATTTIPIVFEMGADPIAFGLGASLNRPGSNITVIVSVAAGIASKQSELLNESAPGATGQALLVNPANPSNEVFVKELQLAAGTLGIKLHVIHVAAEQDLAAAFARLREIGAGGLVIPNEGLFLNRSEQLAALTVRHAVPAIMVDREFVAAGGLMSYGSSRSDAVRVAGVYTARILKGEKPAELPVQQATKVELFINMKAAKALGLTVPLSLLGRADEVIE